MRRRIALLQAGQGQQPLSLAPREPDLAPAVESQLDRLDFVVCHKRRLRQGAREIHSLGIDSSDFAGDRVAADEMECPAFDLMRRFGDWRLTLKLSNASTYSHSNSSDQPV